MIINFKPSSSVAELDRKREAFADALQHVAERIIPKRRKCHAARIEEIRLDGEYHLKLGYFITIVTIERAIPAAVFDSGLQVDPAAGRAGVARLRAAELFRQHQDELNDFERATN